MQQAIVGDSAGKKQRDRKLNKEDLSKVYDAQGREEVQGSCSAIDVDDMEEMINQEKRMRSRSEWMMREWGISVVPHHQIAEQRLRSPGSAKHRALRRLHRLYPHSQ